LDAGLFCGSFAGSVLPAHLPYKVLTYVFLYFADILQLLQKIFV
jgi:hypothetical protein